MRSARSLRRLRSAGFSLVEPLIALALLSFFFTASSQMTLSAQLMAARARSYDAVEAAASSDLGWLRWYANTWRCFSGRYPECTTKSSYLSYNPTSTDCANIGQAFLTSASGATTTPPRPFAVPSSVGVSQVIALNNAPGTTLTRTIALSSSQNRFSVSYSATGAVSFTKDASFLIEAAAWCS
jgi:Tfp pilus assembly protein PilV